MADAATTEPMIEKPQVILFGNPGVGKSALLNTLTSTQNFPSGPSIACGLTKVVQTEEDTQYQYSDTPGLDDDALREHASEGLSNLLRVGGCYKLIFVATLESGRIRARDIATIQLVLSAIEEAGINPASSYSIFLNKCTNHEITVLRDASNLQQIAKRFAWREECPSIYLIARVDEAMNARNTWITPTDMITSYVHKSVAIRLPKHNAIKINHTDYEGKITELERKLLTFRFPAASWRTRLPQIVGYTFRILGAASVALVLLSVPVVVYRFGGVFLSRLLDARKRIDSQRTLFSSGASSGASSVDSTCSSDGSSDGPSVSPVIGG